MDRDNAVIRVQQALSFKTTLSAQIVLALQDSQIELEQDAFLPWFLQTDIVDLATINGTETVTLPPGFLREVEDDALYYFDGTANVDERFTVLGKSDTEFLRGLHPGEGKPKMYALEPTFFRIFPTPDAIYVLKLMYYKAALPLTSNIENKWLLYAHELMIGEAIMKIAQPINDASAEKKGEQMSARGRARLITGTEARTQENNRPVMGGED